MIILTLLLTLTMNVSFSEPPRDPFVRVPVVPLTAEEIQSAKNDRIAISIRECESGNRNIKNKRSSASGYYQFIDSTWEWVTGLPAPAQSYSFETQHAAFLKLWDDGNGAAHWAPSAQCWRVR